MKRTFKKTGWLSVLAIACGVCGSSAADEPTFKNSTEKASYSIGANIGGKLKQEQVDIDPEFVLRGLKDGYAGQSVLSDEEIRATLVELNRGIGARRQELQRQLGEKNKLDGATFLNENKTRPGVITLPSGLQYKVLAQGEGESPAATDTVTVNYQGTLIDGTQFDSSYERGQPATFQVNGVIKGWTEALQLMKPGAKWQLFVPSDLAYGENARPPHIGPNSTLIFEVELLSFKSPEPAAGITPATRAQPVTSDIIKVPSKDEMERGAKIEIIKAGDVERLQQEQERLQQAPDKQ